MKTLVATAVLMASVSVANASEMGADVNALKAEAVKVVMSFGGPLKQALGGAIKADGPVAAIQVCNVKAPALAKAAADASGWSVGRTSLKLRNADNKADAWELATLKEFDSRRMAGEKPETIAKAEIVEEGGQKTFRFMKAIGTAPLCLTCHGGEIKPEVTAKLDSLYPHDQARGYTQGEVRGAFTLKKAL